jgi:hypothetical protein
MAGIQGFRRGVERGRGEGAARAGRGTQPPEITSENEDGAPAPHQSPEQGSPQPGAEADATGQAKPGEEATDVNAAADAEAKETFEAWAAKHKDRSPEELLRLAFDKEQARKVARHDAKEARTTLTSLRDGVQKRMADLASRQATERQQFAQTLQEDPDKAAQIAFERTQERERRGGRGRGVGPLRRRRRPRSAAASSRTSTPWRRKWSSSASSASATIWPWCRTRTTRAT